MHLQVSSTLLLSIAVFPYRFNNLFVSFAFIHGHLFRKNFIEARPVHGAMAFCI